MSEKFQRLQNEEDDVENSSDLSNSNNGISMSIGLSKSTDRLASSDDSIQVQFSADAESYSQNNPYGNNEEVGDYEEDERPPADLEPSPKAAKSMEKDDTITCFFGLTRYQFLVLFSAWVGWGFDLFDSLLFTYAAPVCIPYLLGLDPTLQEARDKIALWTAILTSLLLLGWAAGGILFGVICDKIGRARTMFFTIVTYSISTALCAASWNIWILAIFRFTSALGIGGEWAAGASLVAETLPERKRVLGGVILYTAAPIGGLLGFLVNLIFTSSISDDVGTNGLSWRLVFLSALLPVAITCFIRAKVKEPEMFSAGSASGNIKMVLAHPFLKRTLASLVLTITSLITWWCISTFIPIIFIQLASDETSDKVEAKHRARIYTSVASVLFYIGGFFGTIANYPLSKRFGRIAMLRIFLGGSFVLLPITFLPVASMPVGLRLTMLFFLGGFVTAIFALFIFYLPEQFPTYLRATGAGFTYNAGRCITAVFPFLVGMLIQGGYNPMKVVVFISIVPFVTFLFLFFNVAIETKDLDLFKNDPTNRNGVEVLADNTIQITSGGRI